MNAACSFVDVPLLGIGSPPSQELHHFTNREQEQDVLRRLLALTELRRQLAVSHRFAVELPDTRQLFVRESGWRTSVTF